MKLGQLRGFAVNDFDTGIYANLVWNIAHGEGFWSDVLRVNHLGEHVSPIVVLFAPFAYCCNLAAVLLLAQGAAVALAIALMLPLLADIARPLGGRRWLVAIGLTLAATLYKPLLSALWFEFHPSTLGMPLLVGALIAMRAGRMWTLAILVALLLTTKELAVASTLSLALYAALVLRRTRLAGVLAAVAVLAAIVAFAIVLPTMRGATWGHVGRFAPLASPLSKEAYLALLLAGLGFLPLLSWRALIPVLPLLLVNLSVGFPLQFSRSAHYDDHALVFLLVGAAHGAVTLGRALDRVALRSKTLGWSLALPAIALVAVCVWEWRGRLPHQEIRRWRLSEAHEQLRARLAEFAHAPPAQGIVAQAGLGPYVNQRYRYEMIRTHPRRMPYRPGDLILITDLVDPLRVDLEQHRRFLANSPHAEVVARDHILQVFRWNGPPVRIPPHKPGLKTDWKQFPQPP